MVHQRIGDAPPKSERMLLVKASLFQDSTAIIRVYPLPFVCYVSRRVGRSDVSTVVELRVAAEETWPEVGSGTAESRRGHGVCTRSDVEKVLGRIRN